MVDIISPEADEMPGGRMKEGMAPAWETLGSTLVVKRLLCAKFYKPMPWLFGDNCS